MNIKIKSLAIQNFKGRKKGEYSFGNTTKISGANASGKTTLFDAFTWLLFGRDSLDNAKFEIRPLDADGKQIDNVEICVSAVIEVNGEETELKKTQKQNWVKKRGSENPVLQGNVNTYEIDGYPKSEKEYKDYINSLVSDDLFKMLTNPLYFPNLKWKDQREVIMGLVSDMSDYNMANEVPMFAELLPELKKAPSTDDIQKKYQKALSELKKTQSEIPVRIDELENQKVIIDIAELELGKKGITEQLEVNRKKQNDISESCKEMQEKSDGILELHFALNDLQRKANEANIKAKSDLTAKKNEFSLERLAAESDIKTQERQLENSKKNVESLEKDIEKFRNQWKKVHGLEFDDKNLICSYCGQKYSIEKQEEVKAEFANRKEADLKFITDLGNTASKHIEEENNIQKSLLKSIDENTAKIESLSAEIAKIEKEISELPTSIDISMTPSYLEISAKITEKEKSMEQSNSADEVRKNLKAQEVELQNELSRINAELAKADINSSIDDRIDELRNEQRSVSQKIANQEKMLYLLDEFIKYKLDKISESINSKFEMVEFILFKNQTNGGIAETCECEYNGVPFSSLNAAAKIQCGLDIIRSLQRMYGTYCPVFIDNRESCTDIPTMDCQVISLYVSPTDKELKIEVE